MDPLTLDASGGAVAATDREAALDGRERDADAQGYQFPLLADFWPHGAVAADYGVLHP